MITTSRTGNRRRLFRELRPRPAQGARGLWIGDGARLEAQLVTYLGRRGQNLRSETWDACLLHGLCTTLLTSDDRPPSEGPMAVFTILNALLVGVVATVAMDLVAAAGVALHIFRIPLYGRWFLYGLKGTFRHADIEHAPPLRGENALMLPLHYLAGTLLAAVYLFFLDISSLGTGNVLLAAGFGLISSAIPFFLMLPSMGYGLFGLGHSRDTFWIRQILLMHLGYGVGIGLGVLLFVPA